MSLPEGGEIVLDDPGSTNNFITHKFAEKFRLLSEAVFHSIKVIEDRHSHKRTRVYKLSLTDMQGRKHNMQALCMDSITDMLQASEVQELIKNYPEAEQEPDTP